MTQGETSVAIIIFGVWILYLISNLHVLFVITKKTEKFNQDQNRIKQRLTVAKDRDDKMLKEMREIRSAIKQTLKKRKPL